MVRSLPLTEGRNETELSCISVYLSRQRKADLPQTDSFYVYVVLDGSIRFYTPSGILDYLPGQYSVSKIDTPASGHVLTFSEQGDFLALAIELTLNDVISILLDLDGDLAERIADGGLDSRVTVSADAHVTASIGSQFLQSVINIQQAGEIYEINSWIKENFRDSFTVEELAEKPEHERIPVYKGLPENVRPEAQGRYREKHIGPDRSVETGEFSGETGKQLLSGAC